MNLKQGRHEYNETVGKYKLSFTCDLNLNSNQLILFIHGLACSRESFRNVFDRQHFSNKSLMLVDLIGFGKSSKPDDFSYSMEDQAALYEQFLTAFSALDIHVVAHSMGNAIALLFSPAIHSQIRSYACIEGNLISADCGLLSRGIADTPYQDYSTRIFKAQQKEFFNHPQLRFNETTPVAIHRSAQSLVQWSDCGKLLVRFKKLACKKAYFWGEENHAMPVLQQLPDIRTYMIHRSGHGMMTDNPDEFYATLAEFIDS